MRAGPRHFVDPRRRHASPRSAEGSRQTLARLLEHRSGTMTHATRALRCRDVVDFIDRYYGGELAPDSRRVFEDHVGRCPECRAYLRSYAETIRLAKDAWSEPESAPPAGVPEELLRAILAASRRGPA